VIRSTTNSTKAMNDSVQGLRPLLILGQMTSPVLDDAT
jgi:hypothetical protein